MMAMVWDRVMLAMKGRTVSGASVCPRKMLAAAERASTPGTPSALRSTHATAATTRCITP